MVLLHDLHCIYSAILLHLPYLVNSGMMILLVLLVKSEFILSVERQMILK